MLELITRLIAEHDLGLVLLAGAVGFLAILVAIGLCERARGATGHERWVWLGLTAAASGYGIWACNFIAIAAFGERLGAGYNIGLTLLSFLSVTLFNAAALFLTVAHPSRLQMLRGVLFSTLGIGAMHICAAMSMELPGRVTWAWGYFAVAIFVGVVLDRLAFITAFKRPHWSNMLIGAALATFAILCSHFLIVAGMSFLPASSSFLHQSMSGSSLSMLVAALAIFILGMCLVTSLADNHSIGKLGRQKALMDSALKNISQGLCILDADARILMFNERYVEMTGLPAEALLGHTLLEVLTAEHKVGRFEADPEAFIADILTNVRKGKTSTAILPMPQGRTVKIIDHPMENGRWVSTFEDITEWQEAQATISHMAQHDALTDLPNRRLFLQRLKDALSRTALYEQAAIFCVDLDHFKEVNDSLGHPIGDALLKVVAERLLEAIRQDDTVARLGGDEFAIIQVGSDLQLSDASALASRLIEMLSAPYLIDGHEIIIGASVGISIAPTDGVNADQLIQNADIALYRSKANARGSYCFFEAAMEAHSQMRRRLFMDLRAALGRREFEVYYQPIHDLKQSEVVCFEALVRWNHPTRGLISPGEFIPLAEETGLIIAIGDWVLRQACQDAASWSRPVSVAINLSPMQFRKRNLVASVKSALVASRLSASRLELEITEAVLLHNTEGNLNALHELRAMGIRISMDDFGTGYSSLSYLQSFPFDKIKIDQSFIRGLGVQDDALAIVRAVTGLGKSLGIRTTAEGVETREQLAILRAEGCVEVQGYFFDKPRPASEVETMLHKQLRIVS